MSLAFWSRRNRPCSTSCMQAVAVIALVIDRSQNTVSGAMDEPCGRLALPSAPS